MASSMIDIDNDALYKLAVEMKEDKSQLVSIVYRILDSLAAQDMSYVARVPPPNMGIHPDNRAGKKMLGADMASKGAKIVDVGFTFKLCGKDRAIAFENSPVTNHCELYTIETTIGNPMFYQYKANTVRAGSVGCGHLNQLLAATSCDATTTEKTLQVPNKQIIDSHRIKSANRDLASAVEEGLEWTIIKHQVENRYPELPELIQRALNVEHHVGKGESWDEQFRFTVQKAIAKTIGRGSQQTADWIMVSAIVAASRPPYLSDLEHHIEFLKKWGGGIKQQLALDTLEYIGMTMPQGRIVHGSFIGKLAALKLGITEQMPYMVHAALMLQACGEKTLNGAGASLTNNDPGMLATKLKAKGLQANSIIEKGRSTIAEMQKKRPIDRMRLIGDLSVDLARFVFNVNSVHESMDEISQQFVDRVCGSERAADETEPPPAGNGDQLVTFSEDGSNNAGFVQITSTGVKKGAVVQTSSEQQYLIEYVNDDGSVGMFKIARDGTAGEDIHIVSMAEVLKNYKVAKVRSKMMDGYPENSCVVSQEYLDLRDRATIVFALDELHKKSKHMTYTCQSKPTQRLFASLACHDIEGMCIVPLTTSISKARAGNPESAIATATLDGSIWKLGRQTAETCVSEFFLLRQVEDRKSANMVLKTMVVKVDTPRKKAVQVSIVCAVNNAAIAKGAELVLYIPKKKRRLTAIPQQVNELATESSIAWQSHIVYRIAMATIKGAG